MTPTTHVTVVLDGRFARTPTGEPGSSHMGYASFAKRYTAAWKHVTLVARIFPHTDPLATPLAGPGVTVHPLPPVRSVFALLRTAPATLSHLLTLSKSSGYILRIPGFFPSLFWFMLCIKKIPYGVEVVADPSDIFGPNTSHHPLRPLLRFVLTHLTRLQCRHAKATAYVTENALQKRYPPAPHRPTFSYTTLNLPPQSLLSRPRTDLKNINKIICIAAMQKLIKGQDTLLHALALLHAQGHPAHLTLVGQGTSRPALEALSKQLGLSAHVTFTGQLPGGEAIFQQLDHHHLFVLPSRQEGLPRALLEALARGLPAIATRVGGAPELLPEAQLVPPNNPQALANKISEIMALSPKHLTALSAAALATAVRYTQPAMQARRESFFNALKE